VLKGFSFKAWEKWVSTIYLKTFRASLYKNRAKQTVSWICFKSSLKTKEAKMTKLCFQSQLSNSSKSTTDGKKIRLQISSSKLSKISFPGSTSIAFWSKKAKTSAKLRTNLEVYLTTIKYCSPQASARLKTSSLCIMG